jgi:hypothetical protein
MQRSLSDDKRLESCGFRRIQIHSAANNCTHDRNIHTCVKQDASSVQKRCISCVIEQDVFDDSHMSGIELRTSSAEQFPIRTRPTSRNSKAICASVGLNQVQR